jgi:hypothetical protein
MRAEPSPAQLTESRPAAETVRPGGKIPCDGEWQPHCKSEEPAIMYEGDVVPVCRAKHRNEIWHMIKRGRGPGVY